MDETDFSKPSENPFRQVLRRRAAAFGIDMLLLGAAGMALGTLFYDLFCALGAWGRVIGFVVALAYFGFMQSRRGGGQSLGQKVFGVRVIARNGEPLSGTAAVARAFIFCLAYFLNGANFNFGAAKAWLATAISILVFGMLFSIVYLLLFNRRTKQSAHDLAVGAFVVRAGPASAGPAPLSMWRGHAAILAVGIVAISTGGILLTKSLLESGSLSSLFAVQNTISALPGVDRSGVNLNTFTSSSGTTHRLIINAVVKPAARKDELAQRIAQIALANAPEASHQQAIVVTLSTGYDIGIASWTRSATYVHTPEEWQKSASTPHP